MTHTTRYTAVFILFLFISFSAVAQGNVTGYDEVKGGIYPYGNAGIAANEGQTGFQIGAGLKTFGKNYAPLGGQVELNYLNTGINSGGTASFLNFSFLGAVTTFRQHYNYHVAIGPSIMFDVNGNSSSSVLYNFYPRIEGGVGYGKFMVKAGLNFSLNSSYTNLYSFTLCMYPTRKKTWTMAGN